MVGVAIGLTVIGTGTRILPPSQTHAQHVSGKGTNPRKGADQEQMYSPVVFGGGGRCPGSICWVTSYGQQPALKSTKLLELCHIIPANSLPRLGPAAASMQTLQQRT